MIEERKIIEAFAKRVNADKKRAQYLVPLWDSYDPEDIVHVTDKGVEFYFPPYTPILSKKLRNGGKFEVWDFERFDTDKDGYMHHPERTPFRITTPSGYVYEGDTIDKDRKVVYWDINELTKKSNPTIKERKLIHDLKTTTDLAREELRNICDAWNWVVDLTWNPEQLRAHNVRKPVKKCGSIRVNVRKMF